MFNHNSVRHTLLGASAPPQAGGPRGFAIVRNSFVRYLTNLGYAAFTIDQYQRRLTRVNDWLRSHRRRRRLRNLNRHLIPSLLKECLPGCHPETINSYRKVLFHWLRFQGRYHEPIYRARWKPWLDDYLKFLQSHRGVGPSAVEHSAVNVHAFLRWQFGRRVADWSAVTPQDIWCFAQERVRCVKPIYGKACLGYLRRFLKFVHMRGACSEQLASAVPKIAIYGEARRPEVLSPRQRRDLLASFSLASRQGKRNYAMTLCMLDLGLRGAEVINLRLGNVDWKKCQLSVPAIKTGRGRDLPLPGHVFAAIRDYVENARPKNSAFDHLFLRHPRRCGHPLSRSMLKQMIKSAYRRCGFPKSWSGTHRLRHTFATRLHQGGADMKPIADLLGHRQMDSTNIYTRIQWEDLRPLAQPWPR